MNRVLCASFFAMILFACNKKEAAVDAMGEKVVEGAARAVFEPGCSKELITDKPVKAGESGIVLPAGTKFCFTEGELEIRIELPADYSFVSSEAGDKAAPVYATYSCICSAQGSACKVFYADGLGFGCLQSSCTGSCTGRFTYAGYTVDKVIYTGDKESFFKQPEIQKEISEISFDGDYSKQILYGISFYLVANEKVFLPKASCDCEGTAACQLKSISIPLGPKIYFCNGTCNGCELTVS